MSIYLQHFALAREPFSIVPDPGFLYPSIYHRQAVAHLKYGLDREGGFILLTGEVGTGKDYPDSHHDQTHSPPRAGCLYSQQ